INRPESQRNQRKCSSHAVEESDPIALDVVEIEIPGSCIDSCPKKKEAKHPCTSVQPRRVNPFSPLQRSDSVRLSGRLRPYPSFGRFSGLLVDSVSAGPLRCPKPLLSLHQPI